MYNGYKNYQTWAIFTFITNTEETYTKYLEALTGFRNECTEPAAVEELARLVKEDFTAYYLQAVTPSDRLHLYDDILEAALEEVDFLEIAHHIAE